MTPRYTKSYICIVKISKHTKLFKKFIMKLLLVANGKCFAFLGGGLDLEMKLTDVRVKLKDEVNELMPQNFNFLYENIAIAAKQEYIISLKHCVEKDEKEPNLYKLHFVEAPATPVVETNYFETAKSNSAEVDLEGDIRQKNSEPDDKASFVTIRSKIVIPMFTDEEINDNPCWLETHRRQHWNLLLKQVRESNELVHTTKRKFLRVIDTSWTLKKAELLQLRASELEIMRERYQTLYNERRVDMRRKSVDELSVGKNVEKNLELTGKYLFLVRKEDKTLQEFTESTNTMQQKMLMKRQMHDYLTNLKKASDSLFKSLAAEERRLKKFRVDYMSLFQSSNSDLSGQPLSFDEEQDIATEIQQTAQD